MPKVKKIKTKEEVVEKTDIKSVEGDEETEKDSGTLSDGVLDAFDEVAPTDILEEDDLGFDNEDDDELDSGDYRPNDDW